MGKGGGAGGHCQVLCGIFDDPKLVAEVREACATVRKAMGKVAEAVPSAAGGPGALEHNQAVRWVVVKDEHCSRVIDLVTTYCLCQRVKPFGSEPAMFASAKAYEDALISHHAVLVAATRAKQTVDVRAADALDHAVDAFVRMYLPAPPPSL